MRDLRSSPGRPSPGPKAAAGGPAPEGGTAGSASAKVPSGCLAPRRPGTPARDRHKTPRDTIPKGEVFAIFATAPVLDANEMRGDLDEDVSQDLRDPYEGTGCDRP
jgi:hypothetical protein